MRVKARDLKHPWTRACVVLFLLASLELLVAMTGSFAAKIMEEVTKTITTVFNETAKLVRI